MPILRALVVENDLASRELLARVLRRRGLDARTAIGLELETFQKPLHLPSLMTVVDALLA